MISQQKKALEWYEQLAPNSDRKRRIQKAQDELALDDWSDIDVSTLDSKMQQKLINEAQLLSKETKLSTDDASLGQSNANAVDNSEMVL